MDNKFIEKITDEIWGRWWSIPIFLIISVIIAVPLILNILSSLSYSITENGVTYNIPRTEAVYIAIVVAVCFLGLNLWNTIFVLSKNHIRKAHKGKNGILIYIDTNNESVYKETIRKFGEELKENLYERFDVIYVPYGIKKIEYRNSKIVSFLQKKNCILFLNIGINYDKDGTITLYDMKISGSIIHSTYPEQIEKEFRNIFSSLLYDYKCIEFQSNEMIKRLRVTATEISLACEYIIALSLFLNGDFNKAENLFCAILKRRPTSEQWVKVYTGIQKMRHEMFIIYAMIDMERYQRQCDDEDALDHLNDMLEKAKECCGMTYEYCLNKAYYSIAKDQNSKKAMELINMCKQMKHVSQEWKYSEAFLKAYENKTIGAIVSSYNSALRVEYNIADLIVYIESVLEKEPNRIGLFLAVGILYKYIGDEELASENINMYVNSSKEPKKTIEILKKKNLYFKQLEKCAS